MRTVTRPSLRESASLGERHGNSLITFENLLSLRYQMKNYPKKILCLGPGIAGTYRDRRASTMDWMPLVTNGAPFTFHEMDIGSFPARFYRTVCVQ